VSFNASVITEKLNGFNSLTRMVRPAAFSFTPTKKPPAGIVDAFRTLEWRKIAEELEGLLFLKGKNLVAAGGVW